MTKLWAIPIALSLSFGAIAEPARAGWLSDRISNWIQPPPPPPPQTQIDGYGLPISRSQLQQIHQLGGGVDANGYYNAPIATQQFWGAPIEDGNYAHPMAWHPEHSFVYEVRGGAVVRQDYLFDR